jgi:UDP-arabinose 4-epimerase
VTYDNLVSGHEFAVRWGPLEKGDIQDRRRLDEVINLYDPRAILHFAAYAYVGESAHNPGKYYRNNVLGSLNLLEAARDHGINHVVLSSTCAVYGIPNCLPVDEAMAQNPISPYGASKQAVERMLMDFGSAHGIRSVILRYFNAAGADLDCEIGEAHDPETHLIPLVLDAASGRKRDFTIYGEDYETPDGTCIRDYVHVADLAGAHIKALLALERGADSDVFNLGTGQGFSVRQIVRAVERITNLRVPVLAGPRRAGDPPSLVADVTRARVKLGWQARIRELNEIVETAWAWHRKLALGLALPET